MCEYHFYMSEGALLRSDHSISEMSGPYEVYDCQSGKWFPYENLWDVWHTATDITPEEAKEFMN